MKPVTVGSLKNQTGEAGPHPFLYCHCCGGEYSANAGDYFMASGDTVLKCCDEPMILAVKRVSFMEVSQKGGSK